MAEADGRLLDLSVENQRLRDEIRELRQWIMYLETSTFGMAEGMADGLKAWVGELRKMSPLRDGDQPSVEG